MSRTVLGILAVSLVAACSDSAAPGPTASGEVRLFHGVADLGPVTIEVGNDLLLQNVPYGKLTASVEVPTGTHLFQARAGGTVVASQSLAVAEGSGFTLVLSRQGTSVQLGASADTGLRQPDRANLRIISAPEVPTAPGDSSAGAKAGLLDVYITAPGTSLAGESPHMSVDTGYPTYSTFMYYPAGQWAVRFTNHGTKTVVADSGPISFAAGDAKAVVIRRSAGGSWAATVETIE